MKKIKQHNILKLFVLLLLLTLLSGCYDKKELDNLAYVIAIGIDKGEKEDLKITFQIAVPIQISGESAEGGEKTTFTVSEETDSLYNAMSKINSNISKELTLSHIKLILYSEDLAKNDLTGYVNAFLSNREIRPRTTVAVCEDDIEEFFKAIVPKLETNPARYYELVLSSSNYTGYNVGSELINFYSDVESPYSEASTLLVSLDKSGEEPEPKFNKLAAFKSYKMVGKLEENDLIVSQLLTNNLNTTNYVVADIEKPDKKVTINLQENTTPKISVKIEKDKPKINIKLNLEAKLISTGSTANYNQHENKEKLTNTIKESLEKDINNYLYKITKEYKTDIAGFGKIAKQNYLTWNEFEKINWLEIFPNSEYNIEININLNTSQIISHII